MKYVWILVVVVILVRIDLILRFFEKTYDRFQNNSTSSTQISGAEILPTESAKTLESSPRKIFFSILTDFHSVPDAAFKDKAIEILKANPTLFNEVLDRDLEAAIYRWKDVLNQKNKTTHDFVLEMMRIFKGENLEMLKRFYSYTIDIDIDDFLTSYSRSTDTNCMIMTYLADPLPIEEKYNELAERLATLEAYLASDKPDVLKKAFGQKCQIVLKLEVDRLKSVVIPLEDNQESDTEEAPVAQPATDPSLTPVPGTTP